MRIESEREKAEKKNPSKAHHNDAKEVPLSELSEFIELK